MRLPWQHSPPQSDFTYRQAWPSRAPPSQTNIRLSDAKAPVLWPETRLKQARFWAGVLLLKKG